MQIFSKTCIIRNLNNKEYIEKQPCILMQVDFEFVTCKIHKNLFNEAKKNICEKL